MYKKNQKFLAYTRSYGLQEYEGHGYYDNIFIVEGTTSEEVIEDYARKAKIKTLDMSEEGYCVWGMPIEFIPITEKYDAMKNLITPIVDPRNIKRFPFNDRKEKIMKIFISQPMRGLTDEEILTKRESLINLAKEKVGEDVEVIDSFFEGAPADAKPLWFLGKSIEKLANADIAVFGKGWGDTRGCIIEHECAEKYDIQIIEE